MPIQANTSYDIINSYICDVHVSNIHGSLVIDDKNRVIWLSESGATIIRQFFCENRPIDAKICQFQSFHDPDNDVDTGPSIAILLSYELLRIHRVTGENYDIQLNQPICKIHPSPFGITLQRSIDSNDILYRNKKKKTDTNINIFTPIVTTNNMQLEERSPLKLDMDDDSFQPLPLLYSLVHPSAVIRPIGHKTIASENYNYHYDLPKTPATNKSKSFTSPMNELGTSYSDDLFTLADEEIVALYKEYVCSISYSTGVVSLWKLEKSPKAPSSNIDAASLDISNNSLSKRSPGRTMSASLPSEVGWGAGSPTIFGGSLNIDTTMNSLKNGINNNSILMSGSSSNSRRLRRSPSPTQKSMHRNIQHPDMIANLLGVATPPSFGRESNRSNSPLVSGRITPIAGELLSGKTPPRSASPFASPLDLMQLSDIPLDQQGVNPDLRIIRVACFNQMTDVFDDSDNEIDPANFEVSFSTCFEIMGTLLLSVRNRTTAKLVMLRYIEATSSFEIIVPTNIINDETLCYNVAHATMTIGKTLGRGKGMKIPITILQNNLNDTSSMSLMLGTHIFSTVQLDTIGYENINILSSASIEGRQFFMTNTRDEHQVLNNSHQTQNLSCSLPLAVFMGSDYPNQDIAAMLVASVTNINLVQAALGLMIEIESQLGPKYVVIGLLCSAFFSSPGTDRIKEAFYNVTPKSSTHYLSENINYFSEICKSLDGSTILFDILHTVFEDLHIQASRKMAALRLCDILELVASTAGGDVGVVYSTYYRKFLELENIDLDFYSNRRGASVEISNTFLFTGFPTDTRSSMQWIASCIAALAKLSHAPQITQGFVLPVYNIPILKEVEINSFNTLVCPSLRLCQIFFQNIVFNNRSSPWPQKIADAFVRCSGGSMLAMMYFPEALRHIIELSLFQSDKDPIRSWPDEVLTMIGRNDLCRNVSLHVSSEMRSREFKNSIVNRRNAKDWQHSVNPRTSDGLMEVELAASELRFAEDDRVHEVCRMLRSSSYIYLRIERAPETSDLEHRHKLQMRLLSLCRRSLGCAVGRGMLTMGSLEPLMAEVLPIPPFMLAGRVPPQNTTIQLETSNAPPELTLWPDFHNGVAAGLRVGPKIRNSSKSKMSSSNSTHVGKNVTRNWIIYNRTASDTAGGESGHAGILFALGLLGHLNVLSVTDICDYLTQGHEPTTVAILIGMSAAKLGSADTLLSKTLCLHLPALLPPRHWDIEITPVVQTAAFTGLGLLHCGSAHRLMTEFLLAEMSRRPTSDRCETREAMALSVAWSLGMVLLGKGQTDSDGKLSGLNGLADLQIEDRLQQHMDGGRRPPESHLFSISSYNDHNSKSSRILETDDINTEVTAPGATIALALIYMKSNNVEIAKRLALPTTAYKLDATRPDLLLYRAVGYCLVLWDKVEPSESWIESQVPDIITKTIFSTDTENRDNSNNTPNHKMPAHAALSAYLCIICGYCMGLGLVYAGTANNEAKQTIYSKLKFLQSCREMKPSTPLTIPIDRPMKPLIEMCIACTSVSLSYVMAGTGDLDCLRLLRELRWKVDDVNYGTHLSLAMAIGMLFLAGGNASLQRDPLSIACLLLSVCPRFPLRTSDNQYHLQPLRHMYVLAVEYRALKTIDVDSGTSVALDIEVEMIDGTTCSMRAPCLLPELNLVRAVHVKSTSSDNGNNSKYYPTSMQILKTDDDVPKYPFDNQVKSKVSMKSVPPLYVKKKPISAVMATSQEQNKAATSAYNSLLEGLKSISLPFENDDVSNISTLLSVEGERLQETIILENFLDISFNNNTWHQRESQLIDAIMTCPQLLDIAKFK